MSGLLGLSNQARLLSVWGVLPSYFLSSAILKKSCRKMNSAGEQRHAAIHAQYLAIHKTCRVAGEERHRIGNFLWLGIALQRDAFHQARVGDASGQKSRRGGGAGADRVDAYALGAHLQRQAAGVVQDGGLGA